MGKTVVLRIGEETEDGGCACDWEDAEVESLVCFVDGEKDVDSAAFLCAELDGAVSTFRFVFVKASSVVLASELSGVREPLSFLS